MRDEVVMADTAFDKIRIKDLIAEWNHKLSEEMNTDTAHIQNKFPTLHKILKAREMKEEMAADVLAKI